MCMSNKEVRLSEVLSKLLTDEDVHDVILKGNDGVEVSACRSVLSVRSPVFKAMLMGKFSEGQSKTVKIDEYEGLVLKAVVEYIHTDAITIFGNNKKRKADDEDAELTAEKPGQLVSLAAAAMYFGIPGLVKLVQNILTKMFDQSPHLSFALLEACCQSGPAISQDLMDFAWREVHGSAHSVENTSAVSCLSQGTLEKILKAEKYRMGEFELFRLLATWTQASSTMPNPNEAAKELSKNIRLEKVDPKHLSSTIESSGLVTKEQLFEVYKKQALASPAFFFVWSNTSTKDCIRKGTEHWGFLNCGPIASGVHQWTLQPTADEAGLLFGVALRVSSLLSDVYLDQQKGVWGCNFERVYSDDRYIENYIPSDYGKITVTLDLRHGHEGNGTLEIAYKSGSRTIVTNLRKHLKENPLGFVPVAECHSYCGFSLLEYTVLEG